MQQRPGARVKSCLEDGGVVVFAADTVYGLACDPENKAAVTKLYRIKDRPLDKPSAIMFFHVGPALELVSGLGRRVREAVSKLIPGPVTLILPNPDHLYPLACGSSPGTIGIRVPELSAAAQSLTEVDFPVLASSANLSGGQEPCRLEDVPKQILEQADLTVDAGELPGIPSTVIDLTRYGSEDAFRVIREGAVSSAEVSLTLESADI